jgi:transglutaminase-like putative cysteine protease
VPSIPPPKQPLHTLFSIIIVACLIAPMFLCFIEGSSAATYFFDGSARSRVRITETTNIQASGIDPAHISNGSKFIFNASYPTSSSPDISGYSASYSNVRIDVSPAPSHVSDIMTDQFDNRYKQYEWDIDGNVSSTFTITVTTRFDADLEGDMSPLDCDDPVGTDAFPEYRSPTAMVQSDASAIVNKKNELLAGVTSQAEAVDRIIDHVKTSIPETDQNVAKDALSSMGSSQGNCVNRAHLALALLRSAGIPARCVHGLLYGDKYTVSYPYGGGTASTEITWGSGSHVWLEVYYPEENAWVAYDPWMDKGFADSRHVRLAISKDFDTNNPSTRGSPGVLYVNGISPTVTLSTTVSASDLQDSFSLHYWFKEQSPEGVLMIGRAMQSSKVPTPTVTPTPSPTVRPNNTTATPKPSKLPNATQSSPIPTPIGGQAGDIARYNLTGTIIDHDKGTPVQGATVMLDSIQLTASPSGKFVFLNALSGGTYNLTVSAPGYITDSRAIAPNGADMDVTIILNAVKASAPSSSSWNLLPGPGVLVVMAALAGGALLRRKKKP